MSQTFLTVFAAIVWLASPSMTVAKERDRVEIVIDPHCIRQIRGVSQLDRNRYFVIGDSGKDFAKRCDRIGSHVYDYLIHDLRIRFGRGLGPIQSVVRRSGLVEEDASRPGHANFEKLRKGLPKQRYVPSERFRADQGKLDVAAHGQHNAFPAFMGQFTRKQAPEALPLNLAAAAELSAAVMRYAYSDFDRPAFYEPINEPHWSFWPEQHLADWHLKTQDAVHALAPEVKVGGPCLSVAYLYQDQYRVFDAYRKFIDNTKASLDFYSFHAYDYHSFKNGDFNAGSIQSGLPMENVLDLISNYTHNQYGKEVEIACSEQGGYIIDDTGGYNGAVLAERIANDRFPGSGFEWEMRKRSILDFNHVSTIIANTMTFFDHPHNVIKTVPFILLESTSWDPKYYAVLYTPNNYSDASQMQPSRLVDFYRLFQNLDGHRVKAFCDDVDLQLRAFVDGSKLHIVVNNLWVKPEQLNISAPTPKSIHVRRYGRSADFTPYLHDETVAAFDELSVRGRETLFITADYGEVIQPKRTINEIPCYGDRVAVPVHDNNQFVVHVPDAGNLDHAVLRIGMELAADADRNVRITLNGAPLEVELEDCHARLETKNHGYATCKFIRLRADQVRQENLVTVSIPDGKPGAVGSVVIRAAVLEPPSVP